MTTIDKQKEVLEQFVEALSPVIRGLASAFKPSKGAAILLYSPRQPENPILR